MSGLGLQITLLNLCPQFRGEVMVNAGDSEMITCTDISK